MDGVNQLFHHFNQLSIVNENLVRSPGPQTPGGMKGTRLFGGQTIAQSYLAFKKLYPKTQIVKMDTIFIAPGNVIDSLDFNIDEKTLQFGFTKVSVTQNEKLIAMTTIRFTQNLESQLLINSSNISFPENVNPPDYYDPFKENDNERRPGVVGSHKNGFFEVRNVIPDYMIEKKKENINTCLSWVRLNPHLQIPNFDEPLGPLMLLTDFFIFRQLLNLCFHYGETDETMTGNSLSHNVIIHHTDVTPEEFFLVQTQTHVISKQCAMIDGKMFDEKHRCILTYRQQNYYLGTK
jgi:acyl-CoA thioesterase II